MIGIINYGLGNLKSFVNVYRKLNLPVTILNSSHELNHVSKLVLPGVGSFDYAIQKLEKSGMRAALDELVLRGKVPILGICVGMQMLAYSSEEGNLPGLGWIEGHVKKFSNKIAYIPHMGWNTVKVLKDNPLMKDIDITSRFYFLHSYYFECSDKDHITAVTDYDGIFACAINKQNIFGVQFHPEKSHQYGIQVLENFARM